MRSALVVIALVAVAAVPARAQEDSKFKAFGGFSYYRASGIQFPAGSTFAVTPFDTNQRGWIGSLSWRPFRYLGFAGEVSGHYGGRAADTLDFVGQGLTLSVDTEERTHLFLGGPRAEARAGRFTPFAHVLMGAARREETRRFLVNANLPGCEGPGCDPGIDPFVRDLTETSFTVAVGGGVDLEVADRVLLRLVQADYVRTGFRDEGQNNARFSTGIVIRF